MVIGLKENDNGTKKKTRDEMNNISKSIAKDVKEELQQAWTRVLISAIEKCPKDTGSLVSSIRLHMDDSNNGFTSDNSMFQSEFSGQGKAVSMFNGMITAGDDTVNPKTKKSTISYACFTKNNFVTSHDKIINIFDLKINDFIYSNGHYEQITGINEKSYTGTFYRIHRYKSNFPLELTAEHKVYAIRGKKCPYHKGYDYICRPSCKYNQRKKPVYINCKAYENYTVELVETKNLKVGDLLISPILSVVIDNINISNELCRLIGYFCSEGSIDKDYYVKFSFNGNEKETFIKDVDDLMFKEFGKRTSKPYIRNGPEGGLYQIIYCSKKAVNFFKQFYDPHKKFGESGKKYLPEWCMYLPVEKQKEIICGLYRGDGLKAKNRKRLGIVSGILAMQTNIILERIGFSPSFRIEKRDNRNNRNNVYLVDITGNEIFDFYKIIKDNVEPHIGNLNREYCLKTKEFIAYPIRKIESWEDTLPVRDIEVSNTHNLTVNGSLVKNSLVHDGHAGPNGQGWVEGSFFLTEALEEHRQEFEDAIAKGMDESLKNSNKNR